jgi:hypothetical protein
MANTKTDLDQASAAAVPALFSDTYFLNWWGSVIRICFGEYLAESSHFRTAVVMSFADARKLANDILEAVGTEKAE